MDIDRNAPAIGAGEIQIAASPETVWGILSDIDAWPRWNQDIASAKLKGPSAVGSTFRWKSGMASLTSTLRVVDPPKEIGWTGKTMGISAVHVFHLEPRDGGTFIRSEESWRGALASLMKGYSRKNIAKAIDAILTSLKREAESRSPAT
jgi:uncharacterized protein YndB with AHSA1/START domain